MQKCDGKPQKSIQIFNEKNKNLKDLLSDSDGEFIRYMHRLGMHVQNSEITQNSIHRSTTILTLKTRCFKVDINENFAIIAPLK